MVCVLARLGTTLPYCMPTYIDNAIYAKWSKDSGKEHITWVIFMELKI